MLHPGNVVWVTKMNTIGDTILTSSTMSTQPTIDQKCFTKCGWSHSRSLQKPFYLPVMPSSTAPPPACAALWTKSRETGTEGSSRRNGLPS